MDARVVIREHITTVYGDRAFFRTLAEEANRLANSSFGDHAEVHLDGIASFYAEAQTGDGESQPVRKIDPHNHDLNLMCLDPSDFAKFDEVLAVNGKDEA